MEPLECRCLLAGDLTLGGGIEANGEADESLGAVQGIKWQDLNGDGLRDADEPGLAGVRIYSDLNRNGQLDRGEPLVQTSADDPRTPDLNETGIYRLGGLAVGEHVIRELVPPGYVQTFPRDGEIIPDPTDESEPDDHEFATVEPTRLQWTLAAGDVAVETVSITVHPLCIRPFQIDVVSSDPDVQLENRTGVQLNSCGGDVSKFEIAVTGDGRSHVLEIQFVDAETGGVYGSIPTVIQSELPRGGHLVVVTAGQTVDGIHFGNQPRAVNSIEGHKWLDRDGDGEWDADEPGLAGVRIYLDQNRNGQWDDREPSTMTLHDDPLTTADETGSYAFANLQPGEYAVAEVFPAGYVQTYPLASGQVVRSDTGQYQAGAALDLNVTDVKAVHRENDRLTAELELTVRWRDSCGTLIPENTTYTVVDQHILIELSGHQVGTACADVISPQQQVILVEGLTPGPYYVVGTLYEELTDGGAVPTQTVVGLVKLTGRGQHLVQVGANEPTTGIDFGNQPTSDSGAISGRKWVDRNGNGTHEDEEPGLPGVTIYLDANLNNQFDEGEPHTLTRRDNPITDFDEAGLYDFAEVKPGFYIVREIEPSGYQQTFPEEFLCDAIFCVGRGHMVSVEPGKSYDGLDFGNRPLIETATVEGLKWIDLNGNGQRERNEPPMAGVVIFADLNGNRRLDDDEPHTRTLTDDPSTPMNDAGRYRLEGLPAEEVVIREVVPEGYRQSYPTAETEILESISVDVPGGSAYSLEWLAARSEIGPEGRTDLGLTFEVVWRNGCGTLLRDQAKVVREGDRINVQLFGTHIGEICTLAFKPESQTIRLSDVPAGRYEVRTVLLESPRPGTEFERSFVLEGSLMVGGPGAHVVELKPGEIRQGLHFGNQPVGEPNPWLERADFDYDGYLTANDIDQLAAAIRNPDEPIGRYDLSDDGTLSLDDLRVMVRRALNTHFGDSNLDGRFGTADLVKVFQAGKYEAGPEHPAGWEAGDWNGDGFFDTADMVFVFQEGGYEAEAPLAATPLVASAIDRLLSLAADDDRLIRPRAWT